LQGSYSWSTPMPLDTNSPAGMDLVFSLGEDGPDAGRTRRDRRRVEFRTDVFERGQHRNANRAVCSGCCWRSPQSRRGRCRRWICSTSVSVLGSMSSATGRSCPAGHRAGVGSGDVRRTGGSDPGCRGRWYATAWSMTYRELDEASNRLAQLLTGYGRARTVCGAAVLCAREAIDRSWRC